MEMVVEVEVGGGDSAVKLRGCLQAVVEAI